MDIFASHECQLRRIDPARNMARFYLVSVGRSLFGDFSIIREWGRIGSVGRVRIDLFEDEHAALTAFAAIERRKRKRGYRDAAGTKGRPGQSVILRYGQA
jgi:predicted DNA-binding WGR domain protein